MFGHLFHPSSADAPALLFLSPVSSTPDLPCATHPGRFSQETKASISSKETGLKNTKNELEMTNSHLVSSLTDLKDQQKLLDA